MVVFFYYWYSLNFRGEVGNAIEVIFKRLDNFLASYLVLENNLEGIRLSYFLYPFLYMIPRNIFPNKPFSPNGDLSSQLFGASLLVEDLENVTAWSVNFGLVGEALYVSKGVSIVLQSFIISLSLKVYRQILLENAVKPSYIKFALLVNLYTYPFGIVMQGILNPSTGNILIILVFYAIYKIITSSTKKN
jgi:hypothetical protein